ncbi:hypothetical protein HDA40_002481 [Hamadaea flava]|uniref:Integral membrane protein n=1 Tax=Hamadaea flava TaxID=1742688 RepID=A0ABV8LLR7_9ACTN|nr:hypothetical protein [Hamadaea flava]MCP2323974.1 hypothetical protein [Hamadaea flava]
MPDRSAAPRLPDAHVFAVVQLAISLALVVVAAAGSGFHDDDDPWLASCLVVTQLLPLALSAGVLLARSPKARPIVVISVVYSMLVSSFILLATAEYAMLLVYAGWWISILARMPSPGPKSRIEVMHGQQPSAVPQPEPGVPPQIWVVIALEVFLLCVSGFFSVVVYQAITHGNSGLSGADFLVTLAITGVPFLLADLSALAAAASLPATRRWGRAFLLSVTWLRLAFICTAVIEAIIAASDADTHAPVALCIAVFPVALLAGEVWLVSTPRLRTYLSADWLIPAGPNRVGPSGTQAPASRPVPPEGLRPSSPRPPAPPQTPGLH